MQRLNERTCIPCEGGVDPLSTDKVQRYLTELDGWKVNDANTEIRRTFKFPNFHHTMAFVNGIAWIAHTQDHHPDLEVGYNQCVVRYSTHAISGLSENDFICAAHVDALHALN